MDGAPRATSIACLLAAVGVAAMAVPAWVTGMPVVVASLGASVLLAAVDSDHPESAPMTVITGHWIAIAAALVSLEALGLWDAPSTLVAGVTWTRMLALPLALALTLLGMLVVGRLHTPAGATALLVASSIVRPGTDLVVLAGSVAYVAGVIALFPSVAARLAGGHATSAAPKRKRRARTKRRGR